MQLRYPSGWKEYELIDSGNFEKLERFGQYTLIRPEPQALWEPVLTGQEWKKMADAHFHREQKDRFRFGDDASGGWKKSGKMPDNWHIDYSDKDLKIKLRLALTNFGHVGIFPEQADNWNFIFETIKSWGKSHSKVLNLFAYTGAASVVARMAGAEVTHVDSSRPGLNWANQNMQLNGQTDIRWVYEDALKFARREVKRGNKYNGIIMDPPPYGRGPDGEKWMLQEKLNELVGLSSELLETENRFFILSMYAAGLSAQIGLNVVQAHFKVEKPEFGEFYLNSANFRHLPMGTFLRFRS
ncbi:MAG: class I SAM-dependent methyltransferase [Cyclobacteriaceae bacterium]